MNKVLLFYPSFTIDGKEKTLYTDIPLSVVALGGELYGKYEVEILDERLPGDSSEFNQRLKDVFAVGISATTSWQIINGLRFARKVREFNKNIRLIWGGWHPSLMPYETIRHELVDVIILGQGERVLEKLLHCLQHHLSLKGVPDILYKNRKGEIIKTYHAAFLDLQMPSSMQAGYRLAELKDYIHEGWGNKRVLGYESSRGCSYDCQFCSIRSVFRRKWYGLPAENIYQDINYLKQNYEIDAVHFFDNNFFVDKKRAFFWAGLLQENALQIRWDGTVVVQQFLNFTGRELEFLRESGCYRIIAGIESGDEEVLTRIHKRHRNEDVLKLVRRCREFGILPTLSFMMGFPWNPEKDTENTIRLIEQVKNICQETEILLFIFSPYLGTPLFETAKEHQMIFPEDLEGWACFTYDKPNTPWLSESLKKKMNRYLGFFGTKEMEEGQMKFLRGFE